MGAEIQMVGNIANTGIKAVDDLLQALIQLLEEQGSIQSQKSTQTLKKFAKYQQGGGKLLTIPVSYDKIKDFEDQLNEAKIEAVRVELRTQPGVYQYLFKDKDQYAMDKIAEKMREDGKPLVDSQEQSIESFQGYSKGRYLVHLFATPEAAGQTRLELDIHKIPYAMAQTEKGIVLMVEKDDVEQMIKNIPELSGITFSDPIGRTEDTQKKEKSKEKEKEQKKEKEKTKEKTRELTM